MTRSFRAIASFPIDMTRIFRHHRLAHVVLAIAVSLSAAACSKNLKPFHMLRAAGAFGLFQFPVVLIELARAAAV